MNWLSPNAFNQGREEEPPPRRPHLIEHLPSPVHRLAGHGPAHDLRQHIAEAMHNGDLDAVHRHITHGEDLHVLPPHCREMLDLLWGPGFNTHEWRIGLAHAINDAVELAKQYNVFLQNLNAVRDMPMSPEIAEFYQAVPGIIETFVGNLSDMPPGPRRTRCEATIERLRSAARRVPA